jgi:hypothetical protein
VAAALIVALAALACAGTALASSPPPQTSGPSPAGLSAGEAASVADPSPSPEPAVITCELSRASIVYGRSLTVQGVVTPAVAGQEVVVAFDGVDKVRTDTDASGAYKATIAPKRSVDVTARAVDGAVSAPVKLTVRPAVNVTHGPVIPFLRIRTVVKVAPSAYDGVIVARVVHRGSLVATIKGRCRDGRAVFAIPLRGIDWFSMTFSLPAAQDLGARVVKKSVKAEWRTLRAGSTGLRVKGLLTALKRLKVRVPGVGTTFTTSCRDSVIAFQKAYRLPRTYVVDYDDWRKMDGAATVKPRSTSPSVHLEVDKTRQILMVVRSGKVSGYIPVSTGATGNTPEGAFSIRTKSPTTAPLYGSGFLTWVMGFVGDFAIHGYPSVPPYPASHGCIREPMWVARWTYDQSFIGERLYVYR